MAQDRVQLLALTSGRRVYRDLDKLRSAVPEQVFYSHLYVCVYIYVYKPVHTNLTEGAGSARISQNTHSNTPFKIRYHRMCMNMGTSRPQPASLASRNLQGDWNRLILPGHLLRRGAVVPMQVASHQLPVSYDPVSRRIIGNQAGDLYQARRALTAREFPGR